MIAAYLAMNLSIAAAYTLFGGLQALASRLFPRMSFRTWLRVGQVLLLVALLAPLIVKSLPAQTSERISLNILPPLPEGSLEKAQSLISLAAPTTAQPQAPRSADVDLDFPSLLVWAIVLAVAVSVLFRVRAVLALCRLLKSGIVIRRQGRVTITALGKTAVPFSTLLGGRAWIAVPESILANGDDFKLAVRHELQHHRQRDNSWAILIDVLIPFFVANPFIYFWKRKLSEFQEFSCDEALIGRRVSSYDYGSCLVRVAETAIESRSMLVGTASMAAGFENPNYVKSFLRRRIEMLIEHKDSRPCRVAGLLMGTLAAVCTFALAVYAEQVFADKASSIAAGEVITNPEIQKIAQAALDAALKRHKASLGFVVVADPNSGQILAVANEDRVETQTERSPHWALSLRVGPASITKAFVAAAAVDRGVTSVDEMHNCENGKYAYGGKQFQDWKPFHKLSTAETVIQSSNICGIKVGQKLGSAGLMEMFTQFGFGPGGTAEGFPEARVGEVAAIPSSKEEESVFVATLATGYGGMVLSPVEVVQAMGAIANGGNLVKPQPKPAKPEVIRRVLSPETSEKMKLVLEKVLISGTAMKSQSNLYRLAGKTATGYSHTHVGHDSLAGDANMASFVGFGPVENPRVVVYVGVENPADGKGVHGSYHAAPVFREVAEKTLQYLKVATK